MGRRDQIIEESPVSGEVTEIQPQANKELCLYSQDNEPQPHHCQKHLTGCVSSLAENLELSRTLLYYLVVLAWQSFICPACPVLSALLQAWPPPVSQVQPRFPLRAPSQLTVVLPYWPLILSQLSASLQLLLHLTGAWEFLGSLLPLGHQPAPLRLPLPCVSVGD